MYVTKEMIQCVIRRTDILKHKKKSVSVAQIYNVQQLLVIFYHHLCRITEAHLNIKAELKEPR